GMRRRACARAGGWPAHPGYTFVDTYFWPRATDPRSAATALRATVAHLQPAGTAAECDDACRLGWCRTRRPDATDRRTCPGVCGIQRALSVRGQAVVLPARSPFRFGHRGIFPASFQQACLLQPTERLVQPTMAKQGLRPVAKLARDLESVNLGITGQL